MVSVFILVLCQCRTIWPNHDCENSCKNYF